MTDEQILAVCHQLIEEQTNPADFIAALANRTGETVQRVTEAVRTSKPQKGNAPRPCWKLPRTATGQELADILQAQQTDPYAPTLANVPALTPNTLYVVEPLKLNHFVDSGGHHLPYVQCIIHHDAGQLTAHLPFAPLYQMSIVSQA